MKDASGAEHKMSKSLGNVLDPFEVMDRFGTDALRYYCFREVSFGQDGGVSTVTFGERYETELANELGNLASRTTNMLGRYTRQRGADGRRRPGAGGATSTGLVEEVSALLDDAEITQALDRIWQRVRRLNRYVEENAPWQLAKDETQGRRAAARRCARSPRACGSSRVLLTPYIPESAEKLLAALGAPDTTLDERALRRAPGRAAREQARAAVPQAGMIDSHTHLDRGPAPEAELVAEARAAGRHAHPHDRDGRARRARPRSRAADDATRRCSPPSAATRTRRPATTTASPTGCASSPSTRPSARSARPASTTTATTRRAPTRSARSRAQIALARELGKPLVIHTRAAEDDTIDTLVERRRRASR